ncbi:MAG: O-antigen ligase family protein [Steroidobacteraceae bacterium]
MSYGDSRIASLESIRKGSFAAPLFFASFALACLGSQVGAVWPWAGSALALVVAGWCAGPQRAAGASALSLALAAYLALVVASALALSPAYTPAALYHALLLGLGFAVLRRATPAMLKAAVVAAASAVAVLAVWGLVQVGIQGAGRATAVFETPATFAAIMNLVLLPTLVGLAGGARGAWRNALAVLVAAALFSAASRGGLIAFAGALGVAAILVRRADRLRAGPLVRVSSLIAAGWFLAFLLRILAATAATEALPGDTARAESSLSRLELYAVSLDAWRDRPLLGTGYLTFRYVLEQKRADVPSYGDSQETWFVHNDYLQSLQELGLPGFAAFLILVTLPGLLAYRRVPALPEPARIPVVASTSALASMALHALVDFPFYIPACLLLYGAQLGVVDASLRGAGEPRPSQSRSHAGYRAARAVAGTLAAIVLLRPLAAEAAAEWGLLKFSQGAGPSAARWLGAARIIEPRDWRYHWYEGRFWEAQAADSGKREAAQLAAQAYGAGFEANPLEVKNLLGMISVQSRYRSLLDAPADSATLRQWRSRARELAPLSPEVRRELDRP